MIEQDEDGNWEVWCDKCPEAEDFCWPDNFSELISEMREAGWLSKEEFDGWIHLCPRCSSASLETL